MGQQEDQQGLTYGNDGGHEAVPTGQIPTEGIGAVAVLGTNTSSVETVVLAGTPTTAAMANTTPTKNSTRRTSSRQQRKSLGHDDSSKKFPSRTSNLSTAGQASAIKSIGAVPMPGITTSATHGRTVIPDLSPSSNIGETSATTNTPYTQDEYSDHAPTILVAKLVPDDDELEP